MIIDLKKDEDCGQKKKFKSLKRKYRDNDFYKIIFN